MTMELKLRLKRLVMVTRATKKPAKPPLCFLISAPLTIADVDQALPVAASSVTNY
jgi:hypothetical protein